MFGIASANVAAQRAGVGVGRVRGADRLARSRDRPLALEHERERRPRGDEVDELAEERLLAVLGVVRLAELARGDDEAGGAQPKPAPLEARDDLAGEAALDGVRLGEDQGALDGHAAAELYPLGVPVLRVSCPAGRRPLRASATGASTGTGVAQYGQTCQAGSSGRSHVTHGARSFVVQTGQTRKSGSTSAAADLALHLVRAEPALDRPDLELALADVLEVLRRAEEHVDQRAEERRDRADERRERDEERLARSAAARP